MEDSRLSEDQPEDQRFVVSEGLSRSTDPRNVEEKTIERWKMLIDDEKAIDCKILTVRSTLTAPTRIVTHGQVWEVRPVGSDEVIEVPDWVKTRLDRFMRARMPICQVIYGDEVLHLPSFQVSAEGLTEAQPAANPQHASFWHGFGQTLRGSSGYAPSGSSSEARIAPLAPFRRLLLDPILIVVIPTVPGRGVWVEVAAWFHEVTRQQQLQVGPTRPSNRL